jgi:polysaccharide pyruvyl transferase WcaK-like protein
MRIVLIGDVGVLDENIHIGDEAMFEVFVDQLRRRGAERIVGLSSQPSDTASRYSLESIRNFGFKYRSPDDREACVERMDRIIRTASGEGGLLDVGDPAHAVIEAIRLSDGVGVAGGGNISTLWPMHVFERATLGALARVLRVPLVVSGQTIGPYLDDADATLVRELLSGAALVGVREADSRNLLTSLGVLCELNVDDASFLGDGTTGTENFCLVTLSSHVGDSNRAEVTAGFAAMLDHVVLKTGLEIVFAPHFGSLNPELVRGDSLMHAEVAALMTAASRVADPVDSLTTARLSRRASLEVSSRYHPVVFAVPGGVPAIGVYVDDYTEVKLRGALRNFGQSSAISVEALITGQGMSAVEDVWANRDEIRRTGLELAQQQRVAASSWWDHVASVFGSESSGSSGSSGSVGNDESLR